MVTSFVHHSPEVTTIVILTTFCPFLVTESGADCSDECTIREGIKSSSVCAEHQTVKSIFELFWTEVFLFQFVHPVPFTENSGDTFVFSVVNPVPFFLLFFYTAEADAMDCMFRLQANHIVGEETKFFEGTQFVPILILHGVSIKEAIGFTTFHVNANFGLLSIFQVYVVDHVVNI